MSDHPSWDLPHGDDRLSGYLDGELFPAEVAEVDADLAVDPALADELARTRQARSAVRDLPLVEPPSGFFERMLEGEARVVAAVTPTRWRPTRRQLLLANAVSVAAVVIALVVVGVGVGNNPVNTEVAGAVDAHAQTLDSLNDEGTIPADGGRDRLGPVDGGATPWQHGQPVDDVPSDFLVPTELDGGYELVAAYRTPSGVHLFYSDGRFGLSVFEQRGTVDWSELPTPGERIEVGQNDGWRWTDSRIGGRVVVFTDGDLAVLIAGDESGEAVLRAAASLPPTPEPSLGDRARALAGATIEQLSPLG